MKILAFETSCDDTSIAVFEDQNLIYMDTASQISIHNETGWVVPEVAAREHANVIFEVLERVLENWKTTLEEIDYIGVTTTPGLLPSLLTWTTVAGTISTILNKKIIPINHIEWHIFSNFLEREEKDITFPLACLTVSGGHNDIYLMNDMWDIKKLGSTWDDAGWEAFDKAAKMMWLEYPGWPIISKLAAEYESELPEWTVFCNHPNGNCDCPENAKVWLFPRVWLVKREFNFSFSWLKSSVKREVDKRILKNWKLTLEDQKELSFEFENAITEVLAWKLIEAAKQNNLKTVMLAGWVSANTKLKKEIEKLAKKNRLKFIYPTKLLYCMDNAAMVWINTFYKIKYNMFEDKVWVVKM